MIFLSNFLTAAAVVISWILKIYMWIIIARAILSWVSPDPYNPVVRFLRGATEPLLYRIRRYLPAFGGMDFSPFILILLLYFVDIFLVKTLSDLAFRVR